MWRQPLKVLNLLQLKKKNELDHEDPSSIVFAQDVDDAYLAKVELEAKLEGLQDEINFLKEVFSEVRGGKRLFVDFFL